MPRPSLTPGVHSAPSATDASSPTAEASPTRTPLPTLVPLDLLLAEGRVRVGIGEEDARAIALDEFSGAQSPKVEWTQLLLGDQIRHILRAQPRPDPASMGRCGGGPWLQEIVAATAPVYAVLVSGDIVDDPMDGPDRVGSLDVSIEHERSEGKLLVLVDGSSGEVLEAARLTSFWPLAELAAAPTRVAANRPPKYQRHRLTADSKQRYGGFWSEGIGPLGEVLQTPEPGPTASTASTLRQLGLNQGSWWKYRYTSSSVISSVRRDEVTITVAESRRLPGDQLLVRLDADGPSFLPHWLRIDAGHVYSETFATRPANQGGSAASGTPPSDETGLPLRLLLPLRRGRWVGTDVGTGLWTDLADEPLTVPAGHFSGCGTAGTGNFLFLDEWVCPGVGWIHSYSMAGYCLAESWELIQYRIADYAYP